jgi:hypothetical protein
MGTAPAIWNVILGGLVKLVPRSWWRSALFSNGMASFSDPMVMLTDKFVGETHSIRVDASSAGALLFLLFHCNQSNQIKSNQLMFKRVTGMVIFHKHFYKHR